ncbi:MAG: hypothetical protein KKH72_02485 [Alphaproteobacteria bacterium]|nr:hypothetical protein [Alphaproteobacteria bacterium]
MKWTIRWVPALVLAGLLSGTALADGIAPADRQVWTRYVNERFGVFAEVPALGFAAEPPPENGDGQAWTAPPDVEIAVYGNYWTVMTDSFAAYRDMQRGYLTDDGATITYEPERTNWFVFSGYLADGRIFYDKTVIMPGCDVSANVHMVYPRDQRTPMDAITTRVAGSLALDAGACG